MVSLVTVCVSFCQNMAYKLELRKGIFNLVGQMAKRDIVNIYRTQNISERTIYRTIRDCEEGIPCVNLPKSGRPRVLNAQREQRLVESARNNIGASTRKLGRRFRTSHMTVSRLLAQNGLKYRKRQKCPKYTAAQLARIPGCCRALRRRHFANNKIIVMDDEKYFTLSNAEMKGNEGFFTDNIEDAPNNVRFKQKAKFADKILVWCAISEAGISRPFVGHVRGEAVDANIYTQRCLPKLLQFIEEHHNNQEIMFWPDLASCHYARTTREWLTRNNIPFVPKVDNPPNVPQARPIENFWALLSRKVYNNGWEAENEEQLRRRIYQKIHEIDVPTVQNLMRDVRRKLRIIEEQGPLSVL